VSDDRARLFVALELPEDVRAALERWRSAVLGGVDGLRSIPLESLHVTLCFLGALPVSQIEPIGAAVADALRRSGGSGAVPGLALGPPTWLPRRRPNVLAVGVEDRRGALAAAQSAVAGALVEGGWFSPESRPFLAHVTVARVARGRRVRPVEVISPAPLEFAGAAITLFRSRADPRGARYEALRSV
jgi:2'-5' RNA ligase